MRRRLVRGGLIGAAVIYGAAALTTGSSGAQVPPITIPDFPFPSFTIPTIPPPTMPPPTSSTTSPPPTMPPPTTSTTSPPPTMPPSTSPGTSLPSAPDVDEVIEEIIDRFENAADDVLSGFEEFQGLLQDL